MVLFSSLSARTRCALVKQAPDFRSSHAPMWRHSNSVGNFSSICNIQGGHDQFSGYMIKFFTGAVCRTTREIRYFLHDNYIGEIGIWVYVICFFPVFLQVCTSSELPWSFGALMPQSNLAFEQGFRSKVLSLKRLRVLILNSAHHS